MHTKLSNKFPQGKPLAATLQIWGKKHFFAIMQGNISKYSPTVFFSSFNLSDFFWFLNKKIFLFLDANFLV